MQEVSEEFEGDAMKNLPLEEASKEPQEPQGPQVIVGSKWVWDHIAQDWRLVLITEPVLMEKNHDGL